MIETDQGAKAKSMKTRHKLISLISKIQDNGEVWYVEENGCNRVEIIKNAKIVDFLIENGVGFVTDKNNGSK